MKSKQNISTIVTEKLKMKFKFWQCSHFCIAKIEKKLDVVISHINSFQSTMTNANLH